MVYADETRPRLQGARLTVWELAHEKVPTTLICDNMAASLMAKKEIDADLLWQVVSTAVEAGARDLDLMRKREGKNLFQDLSLQHQI